MNECIERFATKTIAATTLTRQTIQTFQFFFRFKKKIDNAEVSIHSLSTCIQTQIGNGNGINKRHTSNGLHFVN